MGEKSARKFEFHRGNVIGDGSCLFSTFRHQLHISDVVSNPELREKVAQYVLQNGDMYPYLLYSGIECEDIEEYCSKIRCDHVHGGTPELQALAMLYGKKICLISKKKDKGKRSIVWSSFYGQNTSSNIGEYIYIFYNEAKKHFDPLYMTIEQNPNEKITVFGYNDQAAQDALRTFIRKVLKYNGSIKLVEHMDATETVLLTRTDFSNENEKLTNLIVPNANINLSNKRKALEHNDIVYSENTERELPSKISNKYYDNDKPTKSAKTNINQTALCDKYKIESIRINELTQLNCFANESGPSMEQQPIKDPPTDSNHEKQRSEIKDETESVEKRSESGRIQNEDKLNFNNLLLREVRRFCGVDDNNQLYLDVPIPVKYLLSAPSQNLLEVSILKRDINNDTFAFHSDWKFQVKSVDNQIYYCNPISISLDNETKIVTSSEGIQQLKLQLSEVMLAYSELSQNNHSSNNFSSTKNIELTNTTKCVSCDEFKHVFHLDCAIRLWSKEPDKEKFHQKYNGWYNNSQHPPDI